MLPKEQPRKFKRRFRLLIYPRFQLGLVAANTLLVGAAFVFVAVQIARVLNQLRDQGVAAKLAANHVYFRFLDLQQHALNRYVLVAFVAAFLLTAFATLLISQKLAGPIIRLRGYFREIARSGVHPQSEIRFRRGDFFPDLPNVINTAFWKLSHRKSDRVVRKKAA